MTILEATTTGDNPELPLANAEVSSLNRRMMCHRRTLDSSSIFLVSLSIFEEPQQSGSSTADGG